MSNWHAFRIGRRFRSAVAVSATLGALTAGMSALAPAASADSPPLVTNTINLADGAITAPSPLRVLGASSTGVLFQTDNCVPGRQLRVAPPNGGPSGLVLPALTVACDGTDLVGSLVTGLNPATPPTQSDTVYYQGPAIAGTIHIPAGYSPINGSADGEYVTYTDNQGQIHLGDLTTGGSVTPVAVIPHISDQFSVVRASADTSGVLLEYLDQRAEAQNCNTTEDDLAFISVSGAVTQLYRVPQAPTACTANTIGKIALGGGNAAWVNTTNNPSTINVTPSTSTAAPQAFTLLPFGEIFELAVTSTNVGWITVANDVTLETAPVTGGTPTATSYQVGEGGGLASTGSKFAFTENDQAAGSGVYVTSDSASTPTQIYGAPFVAASAVTLAPGRAAYSDNSDNAANSTLPIYAKNLATTGTMLTAGAATTLESASTGSGISLSGVRDLSANGSSVRLGALAGAAGHAPTTLASSGTTPAFDTSNGAALSDTLSGRRAIYPVTGPDAHDFQVYDDVTGTTTNGGAGVAAYTLWGNYLVTVGQDGTVSRKDLTTGVVTPLASITVPAGTQISGRVAAYGNTVAWSTCVTAGGICFPRSGYVSDVGGVVSGVTSFDASPASPLSISSGYLAYLDSNGYLVAQPLAGGGAITVSHTPCQASPFTQSPSLDGSTIAWLECYGRAVAGGIPQAAPLPPVANPPLFLGDPQAPTTLLTPGPWIADFVTSAVLTTCTITISSVPARTLSCDPTDMSYGEATASWDGLDGAGNLVPPGAYTWTLNASGTDGPLVNTDGTTTALTGSIVVNGGAVPGKPTGVTAIAGNAQATVSWVAPVNHGDTPIIGYDLEYSTSGTGGWTPTSAQFHSSPLTTETFTGLTNGTPYYFRVAAINSAGQGLYSDPSAPVTPSATATPPPPPGITVPGAPLNVTATPGNSQVTVSWTPPTFNGGSPITGYQVQYSTNGGQTWIGAVHAATNDQPTTATITGLTNGTTYIFRVAAINAAGMGPASTTSLPVTPGTVFTKLPASPSQTIIIGQHLPMSTTLTTNGKPVANVPVVLYGRPDVVSSWTQIRSLTTNSNGVVSTILSPNVNAQYSWSFAGDSNDASAASTVFGIGVHLAVKATESTDEVLRGNVVKIYGIVAPKNSNNIVYLMKFFDGQWVRTGFKAKVTQRTLPDGTTGFGYVFSYRPAHRGSVTLRVRRRATSVNLAGNSHSMNLDVD